ncbi:MAG: molybdopterin-binding protein [Alphaproteobacteria bacterium]|nr:molybdopterin-binding protein [Alphaproteobacteria bacterium]
MTHTSENIPTAAILVIGNEILSGRVSDININYIARKMHGVGIKLLEVRVVPDIEEDIVSAVNVLRSRYSYVFTTGGIGPTHDDITSASIAKAFSVELVEHPEAKRRLVAYYAPAKLNRARLRMAYVPAGAELIDNPISVAPGFRIENVYVLAGVPVVMQAMIDAVVSGLRHGPVIHNITIAVSDLAESVIAEELEEIADHFSTTDIGSYPSMLEGRLRLSLVVRGIGQEDVRQAANAICDLVKRHGAEPIL